MKTKHKIIVFLSLSLLLVSTNLLIGNFELKMNDETYSNLLISFLIFDVLVGCVLIFGKMKRIRKKHRNIDYLKSHYL